MTLRQVAVFALVGLTMAGCRKEQPPADVPPPAVDSTAIRAAAERARQDSIAAAERARAAAAERARQAEIARMRETLGNVVYFEYDSEQLTAEAEQKLQAKIAILRSNPSLRVRVEGHADERGSTEYNLALGQRRAETVKSYFQTYGIDAGRVETLSYGEERPSVPGSDEGAWARNRRAEFVVTGGDITSVGS